MRNSTEEASGTPGLKEYLRIHPWPAEYLREGRPAERLLSFPVGLPLEDLWPLVSDTSTLNGLMGLGAMKFEEREGRLYGSYEVLGIRHAWEEVPWQWEYGREISAERFFSEGIPRRLRMGITVEEEAPGACRAGFYFGFIPRRPWWGPVLSATLANLERRFPAALAALEARAKARKAPGAPAASPAAALVTGPALGIPVPPEPAGDAGRVASIASRLKAEGRDDRSVDALAERVLRAHASELARIRPKALARAFGVEWETLLGTLLHATRLGLLSLSWDVICPHCRGVRKKLDHLWELPRGGSCEACGIDFDATGLDAVEITFRPNPEIRAAEEVFYCSAEPAKKPHIRMQRSLGPGQSGESRPRLGPGSYRLRLRGGRTYSSLDVEEGSPERDILWSAGGGPESHRTGPDPVIRMENPGDLPATFVLEEHEADREALRPRELFGSQEFRDLFSDEFLPAEISIDVGIQNILMVDLVRSTELYQRVGNAKAFALVKSFFSACHDAAVRHGGAIVKTLGDAALMSFARPLDAYMAGLSLVRILDGKDPSLPLAARVTVNRGSCLAVNLNSGIDYFGQTVNLVAKLQEYAGAGDIVLTEAMVQDEALTRHFRDRGVREAPPLRAEIKGIGEVPYWKVRLRKKGADTKG
jgi:class 3 adenylate cyclase